MKQFQFRLDPVLNYKQRSLDELMAELGDIRARVAAQENRRAAAYQRLSEYEREYSERKASGLTIVEAMECQSCQQVLDQRAKQEQEKLLKLRREEAKKQDEVIEARKETRSLERLKDIRRKEYDTAVMKAEEKALDDLTASRHIANAS